MTGLQIRLLGTPRIEHNGTALEVDTRKAVALLSYLAVTGQPHGRERLASLLWPDSGPDRARASLRRTLSALLKGLDGGWLVADRTTVRLEHQRLWCDVEQLQRLLAAARHTDDLDTELTHLTEAVSLYRGDFLAGFVLRDAPEFDDWQFFTAETLRRELAGGLERLTEGCVQIGDLSAATAHARRWLALDPLHEPAHRRLMLLYAWSDRRQAAMRQFRECLRTLHYELGVAPLPETVELYQALRSGEVPAAPTPLRTAPAPPPAATDDQAPAPRTAAATPVRTTAAAPTPVDAGSQERLRTLPLVGRDGPLAALRATCAAPGQIAVVEGEPGIGKTRLLEEASSVAAAAGSTIVSVRCYDGEQHLAYSAIIELLRAVMARADEGRQAAVPAHWWAEAARLLPELASRAPGSVVADADAPGAPVRLQEALSGLVRTCLDGAPPGVLVIDDAHWLDPAGRQLLAYLLRRPAELGLVVLVAWRTELVGSNHPLRGLLRAAGEARTTHLVLERLNAAQVDRLIDAAAPATPADTRRRVIAETEGVPLFVVEYLSALAAGTEASWTGGGVGALLAEHVARAQGAARQLLTTAAVIGRSFDLDTLRIASGRSEAETVAGLEELLAAGLVREQPAQAQSAGAAPQFDFAHYQLRQQALAETSLSRRRLLHRRVADALAERTRRHGSAALRAQIAGHLAEAGDEEAAAVAYACAGDEAAAVHAISEALGSYEAALALGHSEPVRLHTACGDLHTAEGAYRAALASYETAAALTERDHLTVLEHKMAAVHQRLGEWTLADDRLQAVLATLGDDGSGRRARALADRSFGAHRRGEPETAAALAEQALAIADDASDSLARAQIRNLLGILAIAADDHDTAEKHLQASLELAEEIGDATVRAAALNNLALAHIRADRPDHASDLAEQAVRMCRELGDRHREAAATSNLADVRRRQGQTREAERLMRTAAALLADVGADTAALQPEIWKLTEW